MYMYAYIHCIIAYRPIEYVGVNKNIVKKIK